MGRINLTIKNIEGDGVKTKPKDSSWTIKDSRSEIDALRLTALSCNTRGPHQQDSVETAMETTTSRGEAHRAARGAKCTAGDRRAEHRPRQDIAGIE